MRIVSNLFYFSLSLLLFILNFVSYSYAIGNVDWVLLKENDDGELSLYVMRINCDEKKFKDTSINGIPQFNSKWQTSNNDELIDVVIENSCSEFINE